MPACVGASAALVRVGSAVPVPPSAIRLGAVPSGTVLRVDVALMPRDPAALSQFATEVSTPGSAVYHHYLKHGQFAARFGATGAAIASVRSALRGLGLHPGAVSANHLAIPVTATAGQLEHAFATTLVRYRLTGGRVGFANARAPQLPATAAAHVQAILGLANLVPLEPLMTRPSGATARRTRPVRSAGEPTGGPQPCPAASTQASADGSFTADQLAYAYEYSALYGAGDFGQGVTVAIVEFGEPNLASDISLYQGCYGTNTKVSYVAVDHYSKTGAGAGEAALDIETVIGLAPSANIVVYRGPNTAAGTYDVYGAILTKDQARVISVSYGLCEHFQGASLAAAYNVLFEQAAVQGQTVVVSSGDQGSEACYNNKYYKYSANFPASDPFVTSVGGTSIVTLQQRPGELVWNDGYDGNGASGGGKSTFFSMPSYQRQFLNLASGVREVPDVSANADPEDGYVIVYKGHLLSIGGTSAAAPLWASLIALADASPLCTTPLGFVNPVLYYAAGPADPNIVMDDIQSGGTTYPDNINNDYINFSASSGKYPVLNGYDMATGIGSPVGGQLAHDICGYSAAPGGYWLATRGGHVYAFHAPSRGSVAHPAAPIVGIAADTTTHGYWLVTAKGHVYAFGAPSHGSVTGTLASPVVGIAADRATQGYWLVTAKGHVYAFGAPSHGSVTGTLASPVVGIAADPFTTGYWVATANGKVYALGAGSYPGKKLKAVTAIGADPLRQGYWLATSAGRVYGFHVAALGGMPVGSQLGKIIGLAGDPASGGYWLSTTDGYVAALATAWHGDHPGQSSRNPVVGIAGSG